MIWIELNSQWTVGFCVLLQLLQLANNISTFTWQETLPLGLEHNFPDTSLVTLFFVSLKVSDTLLWEGDV